MAPARDEPAAVDLLIDGGYVLTMDAASTVHPDGAVAIADGRIVAVGSSAALRARYRPREVLDARGRAVLPGLIDTHGHAGHSLVKHIGEHLPPAGWRRLMDHIYFRGSTPAFWHADGMLATLERLKFGTTCGMAMLGSAPRADDPRYAEAFCRGAVAVGGRVAVGVGPPRPPWPKTFSHWTDGVKTDVRVSFEDCVATTEAVIRAWHGGAGGRVAVWVSASRFLAPSPYDPMFDETDLPVARRQAAVMRELADRYRVGIHTHAYGGAIQWVHEQTGILGPDVLLAHCTGASPREIEILATTGTKVSHCPTSRRIYQFKARVPVVEMLARGVTVAIASDGTADTTFDLFKDMRMAMTLQRVHFATPYVLPPGRALRMVTIEAAQAMGVADTLGSLEPGKRADVVLVRLQQPHLVPPYLIEHRLVEKACGHDVETVLVDGRVVVRGGRAVLVDEAEVMAVATEEARAAIARSGVAPLLRLPRDFWTGVVY
ncbi:MAG: amidohydrolase family protein [Armatimonadota bacterium]|nr:amidohydrolase family protein [Armatimonadota bacterium]MDR7536378.1 amidohydrolase family protein [Armatimonadota bacterium]